LGWRRWELEEAVAKELAAVGEQREVAAGSYGNLGRPIFDHRGKDPAGGQDPGKWPPLLGAWALELEGEPGRRGIVHGAGGR
jgi:hypothetical protein